MNIQDVADFIDLVKNPQRYEAVLKNLQDRQEKLNETIENVAKATELDNLIKEYNKRSDELENEYANKLDIVEKTKNAQEQQYSTQQKQVQKLTDDAKQALVDAVQKQNNADQLEKESFVKLQKATELQKQLEEKQVELDNLISEYQDKIAKFKQIVG